MNQQNADGYMYWSNEAKKTNTSDKLVKSVLVSEYLSLPPSLDVETSAYGLLTLVLRGDIDNALPVMRWLISKQKLQEDIHPQERKNVKKSAASSKSF